jgi:hypothetical protein
MIKHVCGVCGVDKIELFSSWACPNDHRGDTPRTPTEELKQLIAEDNTYIDWKIGTPFESACVRVKRANAITINDMNDRYQKAKEHMKNNTIVVGPTCPSTNPFTEPKEEYPGEILWKECAERSNILLKDNKGNPTIEYGVCDLWEEIGKIKQITTGNDQHRLIVQLKTYAGYNDSCIDEDVDTYFRIKQGKLVNHDVIRHIPQDVDIWLYYCKKNDIYMIRTTNNGGKKNEPFGE